MRCNMALLGIATPVGTGDLGQLEAVAELAGARQVRAAADIEPVALAIDGDRLAFGDDVLDDLDLVVLAQPPKTRLASSRSQTSRTMGRSRLTISCMRVSIALQIVRGEGLGAGEVVVEAVLDRRADGHLGARIELLDRLRHDMRGVVAQQLKRRFLVLAGDDGQRGIPIDQMGGIDELAIDPPGEGGLGETRADARRRHLDR